MKIHTYFITKYNMHKDAFFLCKEKQWKALPQATFMKQPTTY